MITHVETTTAPVSDDARTEAIHEGLKHKDLLPEQHIVDMGYVDAQLLHSSKEDYGIDLVGPTRPDVKWQAQQQTGFDAGHFAIDWQAEQATCPEGHRSISWTPAIDNRKNEGDLDQVLDHRLSGLPQSFLVYALDSDPASDHHRARLHCTIRRYSAHGSAPRRRISKYCMHAALAWKEPFRKEFA